MSKLKDLAVIYNNDQEGLHDVRQAVRTSGIVTYKFAQLMTHSPHSGLNDFQKFAVLIFKHVMCHGEYPDAVPDLTEWSVEMADKVDRMFVCLTKRLKVKCPFCGDKHIRVPMEKNALLINFPLFKDIKTFVRQKHLQTAAFLDRAIELKRCYAEFDNRRAQVESNIRCFSTPIEGEYVDAMRAVGHSSRRIHKEDVKVVVQGGGDLYKEGKIVGNSNIVQNVTNTNDVPEPAVTVVSINSQTQKGTRDDQEMMKRHGATNSIAVVPTGIYGKRKMSEWADSDDKKKMDHYIGLMNDETRCITYNDSTNILIYDFAPVVLKESSDVRRFNGEVPPLGHSASSSSGIKRGLYRWKKKFDGVCHFVSVKNGRYRLFPRTVDYNRPSVFSQGTCENSAEFFIAIEIMDSWKYHVTRIYTYNGRRFSPNVSACCNLERQLTLEIPRLKRCEIECDCPSDGVVLEDDHREFFFKDKHECDQFVGECNDYGVRMVEFCTYAGNDDIRKRLVPGYFQKKFQGMLVSGLPSMSMITDHTRCRAKMKRLDWDVYPIKVSLSCDSTLCKCGNMLTNKCQHSSNCPRCPCLECKPKGLGVDCSICKEEADHYVCSCSRAICRNCYLESNVLCKTCNIK